MTPPRCRPLLAIVLPVALALGATACASLEDRVIEHRRADDAALAAAPWPDDATWIVAAEGAVTGAPDRRAALAAHAGSVHRYVFRPGEQGDRRLTIAFHPGRGVVAGRAAAEALGVRFRRDARGETIVIRDMRRLTARQDATITMRLSEPGGQTVFTTPVVIAPEFDGPLLIAPATAERLHLARHEIPGTADVQVALGRPLFAVRARVRVEIPELGVGGLVEAVVPR